MLHLTIGIKVVLNVMKEFIAKEIMKELTAKELM